MAKDRTKHGPTPRRGGRGPGRRAERLGRFGFAVVLLISIAIGCGASIASVRAVDGLRRAAGLTGNTGRLHVQYCSGYRPERGSPTYSCLGEIVPHSVAPWAQKNTVWLKGESQDDTGRVIEVNCQAPDDICVRTGAHEVLEFVLLLYVVLGFFLVGLGLVAAALIGRWPQRFEPYWERFRRRAGWSLAAVGATALGVLIAFAATG